MTVLADVNSSGPQRRAFDAGRLHANGQSVGEGGQVVADVHDAQINQ